MLPLTELLQPFLQTHPRLIPALRLLSSSVNHEAYIVGGCIRDTLLNRPVTDMDLTVLGDGLHCAKQIAESLHCPFIPLDEKDRTGRVVLKRMLTIDITSLKGDSLNEDLNRRDFTINAMAVKLTDLLDQQSFLIDPLLGSKDLNNKRLNAISEQAFVDDPLRLLRAFRFAAQLDLTMNEETVVWIRRWANQLSQISGERILEEMATFFCQFKTWTWMHIMHEIGIIHAIFPEWRGQDKSGIPEYILLKQIDGMLNQKDPALDQIISKRLTDRQHQTIAGDRPWGWIVRLAAVILEQIGTQDENYNLFVRTAVTRLRLSNKEQHVLGKLVRLILQFLKWHRTDSLTDDHLYALACEGKEETNGVVMLIWGLQKTQRHHIPELSRILKRLIWIRARQKKVQENGSIISGTDIIQVYQLQPGPQIGHLLGQLEKQEIMGTIQNRKEAFRAIKYMLTAPDTDSPCVKELFQ
jgi:tRNA nucleotidyltransferase/poly(A) polymerase